MPKIMLILPSKENDKTAWSGTNYNITKALKKHFEVEYVFLDCIFPFWLRLACWCYRFLSSIITMEKCFSKPGIFYRCLAKKYTRMINDSNCEYVFTTHVWISMLKTNKPVVFIIDAVYLSMLNYYFFDISKLDIKNNNRNQALALERSSLIIAASEWCKNEAKRLYSVSGNKIIVAAFGPNLPFVKAKEKKCGKQIDVLFCGIEEERKGLRDAIKIIEKANDTDDDHYYRLTVIGLNGNDSGQIRFIGRLNKNEQKDMETMIAIYNESHFFLLPTKAECAGIVFCEASMFGLPIISTTTGGIPTYVRNGINGYTFPVGLNFIEQASSKLIELANNEIKYKTISAGAISFFKNKLNWDCWSSTVSNSLKQMSHR